MDTLEISVDRKDDLATVKVAGEVDLTSAPRFEDELSVLIEGGVKQLEIDLGGVSFMDSTGLRVLLKASKRLKNGGLSIHKPSEPVHRLLDVSGLISHFRIS